MGNLEQRTTEPPRKFRVAWEIEPGKTQYSAYVDKEAALRLEKMLKEQKSDLTTRLEEESKEKPEEKESRSN